MLFFYDKSYVSHQLHIVEKISMEYFFNFDLSYLNFYSGLLLFPNLKKKGK